jgi:hypothetical protein
MDEELEVKFQRLLKSGQYTTEFWLALSAQLLGALAASGLLPAEHWATQIVGLLIMVLAGMGYKWSRTAVKAEALRTLAHIATTPGEPLIDGGDELEDDDDDDDKEDEPDPQPVIPDSLPLSLGDGS